MSTTSRVLRVAATAAFVLVVALAGSATAGKLVTGKQIKNGTVTSVDVRNGSITGADVRDESLTEADFSGSLTGPPGPPGEPGAQGPAGQRGPDGAVNLEYRVQPQAIAAGGAATWLVTCPDGKRAVGGGVSSSNTVFVRILESAPSDDGRDWHIGLKNEHSQAVTGYAWASCVTAP